MKSFFPSLCFVLSVPASTSPGERYVHEFRRSQLTGDYFCEGASFGDFDRDGRMDVVSGPYWYAGPDFQRKAEIYSPKAQDLSRWADNFFSFPCDFDGDGW